MSVITTVTSQTIRVPGNDISILLERFEPRWYVAQTLSRHEKRVAEQLHGKGIEHFLPLYETMSRWKDRRVRLQLPLFAGYVFARFPLSERLRALEIPGVARLVRFGGLPVAMPDDEMERMHRALANSLCVEPHPYLTVGRRVEVVRGPFKGLRGILTRHKRRSRIILSVELIMRSAAVEIEVGDICPLS